MWKWLSYFKSIDEITLEYVGITKNFSGKTYVIEKIHVLSSGLYWIKISTIVAHLIVN